MITFDKLVNENEYEQDYSYFSIRLNSKNDDIFTYDLCKNFYNIFYKDFNNINNAVTKLIPLHTISHDDYLYSYPIDKIDLNKFDYMVTSMDTENYEEYVELVYNLLGMLCRIDEDMIIYNISIVNYINDKCFYTESDIKHDLSKIEFTHKYDFIENIEIRNRCMHGINVIIKSKIIDLNLIYCLINEKLNYTKIGTNRYTFRIKDDSFKENLIVKNFTPRYITDKYSINIVNHWKSPIPTKIDFKTTDDTTHIEYYYKCYNIIKDKITKNEDDLSENEKSEISEDGIISIENDLNENEDNSNEDNSNEDNSNDDN